MTITEMATILSLPRDTVLRRILRGGYKPITKDALYSLDVFEAIKEAASRGRPKKKEEEPKKPIKKKKNKKSKK